MFTLSKSQFLRRRPEGSYDRYLSYIRANRPGRVAARKASELDYLAPTPPKQLRSQVTSQVNASVNPLLDELNRSFAARAKAGQEAITGYTGSFLDAIKGIAPAIQGAYGQAETQQAGISDALSSFLSGAGQERSAELGQALAAAGQPTGPAAAPAALGQGLAGTEGAMGVTALSRLIAEGAAQQAYALKQPDIAVASGLESSRALGSQLNQQLADALGGATSRVPGTIADLMNEARNREVQKRLGVLGLEEQQARLAQDQAQYEAGLALDYTKLAAGTSDAAAGTSAEALKAREDAISAVLRDPWQVVRPVITAKTKAVKGGPATYEDPVTGKRTIVFTPDVPARTVTTPRPYRQVFAELLSYLQGQVGRYAVSDQRLRQLVEQMMLQSGWWPQGRPPPTGNEPIPGLGPGVPQPKVPGGQR